MNVELGEGAWVALLGWPALLTGAVVLAVARALRARPVAFAGCLLVAPTLLYLAMTPRFRWLAPPAFVLLCVLAWRIERVGRLEAVLLALPAAFVVALLALARLA